MDYRKCDKCHDTILIGYGGTLVKFNEEEVEEIAEIEEYHLCTNCIKKVIMWIGAKENKGEPPDEMDNVIGKIIKEVKEKGLNNEPEETPA